MAHVEAGQFMDTTNRDKRRTSGSEPNRGTQEAVQSPLQRKLQLTTNVVVTFIACSAGLHSPVLTVRQLRKLVTPCARQAG